MVIICCATLLTSTIDIVMLKKYIIKINFLNYLLVAEGELENLVDGIGGNTELTIVLEYFPLIINKICSIIFLILSFYYIKIIY